ncbi:uncharacterized protein LOC114726213 [Neltuma alba]|uniref:uncharacterized protein LOC114726213 n=1 Tax=Neltuma alba TaxID=207710 RepID=UPI0010A52F71|nr:uncharacterized protein LOC114726213 [Prosopis alba]
MEMSSDPGLLFEAENEDDVFYAEIRRRILQLTTEDEEDNVGFLGETKRVNPIVSGGDGGLYGSGYGLPAGSHVWSWEAQNSGGPPPVWLINLWKNGKGTGVFIPQAVRCKKNQRTDRMNRRRKTYKPVATKD